MNSFQYDFRQGAMNMRELPRNDLLPAISPELEEQLWCLAEGLLPDDQAAQLYASIENDIPAKTHFASMLDFLQAESISADQPALPKSQSQAQSAVRLSPGQAFQSFANRTVDAWVGLTQQGLQWLDGFTGSLLAAPLAFRDGQETVVTLSRQVVKNQGTYSLNIELCPDRSSCDVTLRVAGGPFSREPALLVRLLGADGKLLQVSELEAQGELFLSDMPLGQYSLVIEPTDEAAETHDLLGLDFTRGL